MSGVRFVDTNVLVYTASPAPEEADKQRSAHRLLEEGDLALSVQVLEEFYHQATRSTHPGAITQEHALEFIQGIGHSPLQNITLGLFRAAISRRFQLSYWDGATLAETPALGCHAVYSEDLGPEQDYDGLRVIDPFAEQ